MRFETTLLAILDISGYTHFIRQRATTLPHAEEIIRDQRLTVIKAEQFRHRLVLRATRDLRLLARLFPLWS